jgi:hypothetical protein
MDFVKPKEGDPSVAPFSGPPKKQTPPITGSSTT